MTRSQPNSAGERGTLAHILERYGEAVTALTEYAREYVLGAEAAEIVRMQLAEIEASSGFVTIFLPRETMEIEDTRLGELEVHNSYGPFESAIPQRVTLRLRAGRHTLQVGSLCSWHFDLAPGDRVEHACTPAETAGRETAEESTLVRGDSSRNAWLQPSLLGVGATALGAGLTAYLQSRRVTNEAERDYARRCLGESIRPECFEAGSTPLFGQAGEWKTAAAVSAGIGGAALAAGALMYFWPSESEGPVTAWLSPTGVGVSGTF